MIQYEFVLKSVSGFKANLLDFMENVAHRQEIDEVIIFLL
jgi:hypothetical protein